MTIRGLVCALALAASGYAASGYGKTIYFSGYAWKVKTGSSAFAGATIRLEKKKRRTSATSFS